MLSTSKDTVVKWQKATIEIPNRSKPSGPIANRINTNKVAKLTCMGFESSISKVPNISQLSGLGERDPSRRNPILAIADRTEPYCK